MTAVLAGVSGQCGGRPADAAIRVAARAACRDKSRHRTLSRSARKQRPGGASSCSSHRGPGNRTTSTTNRVGWHCDAVPASTLDSPPPSGGNSARAQPQDRHRRAKGRTRKGTDMTIRRHTADHVRVFDTTLRDGEQSPGISLNRQEKVEIAHQLARLGVDVIEAGFPITSPGDFEAVQAIAREVEGPSSAASPAPRSRTSTPPGTRSGTPSARIHTFIATSDIHIEKKLRTTREDVKGQARAAVAHARQYTDDVEFSPEDGLALGHRVHGRGDPDRDRRGRDHDQRARHRRLHDAARVRGDVRGAVRAGAGPARRDALGPLPRRPRAGHGQLARRRHGGARQMECAP